MLMTMATRSERSASDADARRVPAWIQPGRTCRSMLSGVSVLVFGGRRLAVRGYLGAMMMSLWETDWRLGWFLASDLTPSVQKLFSRSMTTPAPDALLVPPSSFLCPTSRVFIPPSSLLPPPSSFLLLPSSILRPPLMQGQIRPNPTTPPRFGTPSSGPDVNPPSSDLGLSSSSSVFPPPSSLLRPQSFSRPAPRRKRIAPPVRNPARALDKCLPLF